MQKRKEGGAAIRMEIDRKQIKVRCKGSANFDAMAKLKVLPPFSDEAIQFLSGLSIAILENHKYKQYHDVIAFAFFIRKANLLKIKSELKCNISARLGKGLVFHIAPSNVPMNFAYSLVAGLLSGNPNIVKISSKFFPQVEMVCQTIANMIDDGKYKKLSDYIAVIQYPNDSGINDYFSGMSQVRMIWGGDQTIAQLKKSPVPPRSTDVTFANRYSFSVVNAAEYLKMPDAEAVAAAFYRDTYYFDQNACFSPRLVYWVGTREDIAAAKERFWNSLYHYTSQRYAVDDHMATEKHMALHRTILDNESIRMVKTRDNLLIRCEAEQLNENILDGSCAFGFFVEYSARDLDGLKQFSSKKLQTLSYFGFSYEALAAFVIEQGLLGVDRIVEIGKANEFSLVWDGIDLIAQLTRIISDV